jgi:hypothetical protein
MKNNELSNVWESRITSFKSSGKSMTQWCTDHEVTLHQLKYWLYKKNKSVVASKPDKTKKWIAVEADTRSLTIREETLDVNVGKATIQVKQGFDPVLLRDVIRILAESC